jgi:succinate dehydrogenase/fumarate reductase-like Fe-S protein
MHWYRIFWWLHIFTVLGFLIYLPRSKHLHLMATPFNVFLRSYKPKGTLPLMENIEEREDYSVSKAEQFTWKQLLDGYACTECGRCNVVCPAMNTDKPLFPKVAYGLARQASSRGRTFLDIRLNR